MDYGGCICGDKKSFRYLILNQIIQSRNINLIFLECGDIIQPQDMKEFCSVLVVYSAEAAKKMADERNALEKQSEICNKGSLAPSAQEHPENHTGGEKGVNGCLGKRPGDTISPE
ncbi:hypothetical protein Leryth_020205 [Lithospermum erythrorhizon]|nr:hypothetical protein Leryth_020205 [Lithospermum erythrorhizon]